MALIITIVFHSWLLPRVKQAEHAQNKVISGSSTPEHGLQLS